ncbi:putative reverse transcriptase domain-containing protein [Tanacetum coccineum]
MAVVAIKRMASNFAKLDKFEGVDFRRWQKKTHFLLSSMSVLYVLTTPIPEDGGDDATMEQIRKMVKWDNDDYVCRGLILKEAKYMAEDALSKKLFVSCIIDKLHPSWKDFKHKKQELTLVELGSHLRIEESLKDEALDKFKVFKTEVELQQGSRIKRFRTDMGGGYMDTQAVVRLPDLKLKTLGERGIECIFVGYPEHSKAFRFYVIESNESVSINSIIESMDAIFDENIFSSVPRPSIRIPKGTEDIGGSVVPEEKEAINDEMDYIIGNNTWVLVDLPSGYKPLGCKWIFKRKLKVDGTIEKFKARLVIQGMYHVTPLVPVEVPIAPADLIVALEDSLPVALELPLVLPFLCSDDSKADSESEPIEQRPERHKSLTPSSEFLLHLLLPHPGFVDGQRFLSDPMRLFPLVDLITPTSMGRSCSPRLVDPLVRTPRCSKAFMRWRSAPLSTFYPPITSESSLDSSFERLLDSSSPSARPSRKRCRSPTTLVPSSTPVSRSIAPALVDLPPRKRFRDSYSSEVSGEEHMEMGTVDAETVADLGISDGVGAHIEDGIDLGIEVATSDIREDEGEFGAKASAGGTMEIVVDPLATGDIFEPTGGDVPDLAGTLYNISHYMSEVPLDRITEFKTTQRQLEVGQLMASEERAGLADRVRSPGRENLRVRALLCIKRDHVDSLLRHMALSQKEFLQVRRDRDDTQRRLRRTMTITRSGMNPEAIEELVNRRVEEALAAYEATRAANALEVESQSQNGSDGDNGNGGNRNGRNGNLNENDRGARHVAQECTYQDFMKCQPLNFKGTE